MHSHLRIVPLLSLATVTSACVKEFDQLNVNQAHAQTNPLLARQAEWPPVLTDKETTLVNSFDSNSIDDWAEYYGHQVKLAGLGHEAAVWTRDKWAEYGFKAELNEYHVYLSYPRHQSLSITFPNGTTNEINIQEPALPEDEVTGRPDSVPTFHGYSASGNASAEYVYVGRGTQADFNRLESLGVDLNGKIALIKYGSIFRGLKVKNAQNYGCIAAVIFTDPDADGNVTVANGVAAYPNGPARHPDSVQKGSVLFLSTYPGDPTTPGYPSTKDAPRADISHVTPKIPSIPISYAAVLPLLQSLDGHGFTSEQINRTAWKGALPAQYSSGPAPGVKLNLSNLMRGKITPVHNVIGYINGTNPDETLIIGNHRDTWMIGGTGDPNSGSAVLTELAKAFSKLTQKGWKPRRNIVFASWDAEEYGLVGSTEWVEEHVNWLTETAVAYLNIDVAVSGPRPYVDATPELHTVAGETLKKVVYPNFGGYNISLFDAFTDTTGGEFGVLGSGSDFTSFLHRGISALDVGAGGNPAKGDAIWHYHSNYDTYHWMKEFGDPGFKVHAAMGQYLGLLALRLIDDEVLPFDLPNYATELKGYYKTLRELVDSAGVELDTRELQAAIDTFERRAGEVKALETLAKARNDTGLIKVVNYKYRDFQRGFVSQGGLPGREFYRHVVTAPGLDTGYAAITFPGVSEGVQYGNLTIARDWVSKTAKGILRAADIIKT
ncbi:putative glutamate carboxypeptidase 2 [Podospora fimiseda]|uniref:Glutamate carboxypeptidase 2 n=1 Tax=Podospora fimiseda TaxID=252190 RepID=A0AAN6YP65_9PEZI|nr:putative glutamate carboxypeptidase 2 [Podospora fimiseda]